MALLPGGAGSAGRRPLKLGPSAAGGTPRPAWRPIVALLLAFSAIACDRAAEDPFDETERIEQLSAIGYVAGTDTAEGPSGVTVHDAAAAQPGLNLMTSGHAPVALLMNMDGEVLHSWRADFRSVFPDLSEVGQMLA